MGTCVGLDCRTPRPLRRTSSSQSLLSGSASASPRLRSALKRASYSGASSSFTEPSRLAQSTLRRSSSFPRSHDLKRTLSLGDIVVETASSAVSTSGEASAAGEPSSSVPGES